MSEISEYKESLAQVQALLIEDPDNEELQTVERELKELIEQLSEGVGSGSKPKAEVNKPGLEPKESGSEMNEPTESVGSKESKESMESMESMESNESNESNESKQPKEPNHLNSEAEQIPKPKFPIGTLVTDGKFQGRVTNFRNNIYTVTSGRDTRDFTESQLSEPAKRLKKQTATDKQLEKAKSKWQAFSSERKKRKRTA